MFRDMGVIINGIKYEVDQSPPSPAWVRVSYSNVNGVKKHTIPAMEPYEFNLLVDFLVSVKDNYIKHEKKEHL